MLSLREKRLYENLLSTISGLYYGLAKDYQRLVSFEEEDNEEIEEAILKRLKSDAIILVALNRVLFVTSSLILEKKNVEEELRKLREKIKEYEGDD